MRWKAALWAAVVVGGVVTLTATTATADTDPNSSGDNVRKGDSRACEISTVVEAPVLPDRTQQQFCSMALGVAERISIGTIKIPFGERGGHTVGKGRVIARHGRCSPHGLALVMVIRLVGGSEPRPAMSAYAFMDLWLEGVAAWGANPLGWSGVDELRVVWDQGRDAKGRQIVRLAGHWQYLPTDGGVRGDAVYEADTVLLEHAWTAPTHRFAHRRLRMPAGAGR